MFGDYRDYQHLSITNNNCWYAILRVGWQSMIIYIYIYIFWIYKIIIDHQQNSLFEHYLLLHSKTTWCIMSDPSINSLYLMINRHLFLPKMEPYPKEQPSTVLTAATCHNATMTCLAHVVLQSYIKFWRLILRRPLVPAFGDNLWFMYCSFAEEKNSWLGNPQLPILKNEMMFNGLPWLWMERSPEHVIWLVLLGALERPNSMQVCSTKGKNLERKLFAI